MKLGATLFRTECKIFEGVDSDLAGDYLDWNLVPLAGETLAREHTLSGLAGSQTAHHNRKLDSSGNTPHCNCILHSFCGVGSVSSRRLLACNFERIFDGWTFTVLTRISKTSAISLFERRLRTNSRISSSRGVVVCRAWV